ncbi:DUF2249 domain-containing protein [Rufibacter latericius]|uniref:DUF2249 domain-containing protein n=1 Tax=Rufibacter latericius TaxID=2487040 RepID=A0A3M9MF60_9BACT|nr:DUF2249 domain-containing protein [Rufibacter latericius]RNI24134.1 DUF2249 domain-containing protein [Rufibacter latericius]
MQIAATTKISAVIKENPAAIEAIVSINRHFEKLRNPLLRKILASRVTIADAARMGGCQVEAFFEKLAPLGFEVKKQTAEAVPQVIPSAFVFPVFLQELPPNAFLYLDVREDIAAGNDPFLSIMKAVEQVNGQNALVILNTFEPTPLIQILQKRGYVSFAEVKSPELVYTYFWRKGAGTVSSTLASAEWTGDFEQSLAQYAGNLKQVDVRQLEMPLPMVTILKELEGLPFGKALHVTHQRVPQFLLPKLQERGFQVAIKEVGPGEVYLLIYKP